MPAVTQIPPSWPAAGYSSSCSAISHSNQKTWELRACSSNPGQTKSEVSVSTWISLWEKKLMHLKKNYSSKITSSNLSTNPVCLQMFVPTTEELLHSWFRNFHPLVAADRFKRCWSGSCWILKSAFDHCPEEPTHFFYFTFLHNICTHSLLGFSEMSCVPSQNISTLVLMPCT